MKVVVTEEHIKKARKILKDETFDVSRNCPIALAVGREAIVTDYGIDLNNKFYSITRKARDFINAFDLGKRVKPFHFYARPLKPARFVNDDNSSRN